MSIIPGQKNLGGPDKGQEPLLPVAERIHSTEFHGNSGPKRTFTQSRPGHVE